MKHLADFLTAFEVADAPDESPPCPWECAFLHDLGADLPAGHLHLWGGPRGAGKTSFLLSLLHGAASTGRRVLYATYHLPAEGLAHRLLAMRAGLELRSLVHDRLDPSQAHVAAAAQRTLARLPFWILEARGMGASSLEDRLVRMPFRAEVLAVDFAQAVPRPPGQDLGGLVRQLSALASRLHVAVVAALEAESEPREVGGIADRAGWIAPVDASGLRRAEVIENRYGPRPAVGFRLDEGSGSLERLAPHPAGPP